MRAVALGHRSVVAATAIGSRAVDRVAVAGGVVAIGRDGLAVAAVVRHRWPRRRRLARRRRRLGIHGSHPTAVAVVRRSAEDQDRALCLTRRERVGRITWCFDRGRRGRDIVFVFASSCGSNVGMIILMDSLELRSLPLIGTCIYGEIHVSYRGLTPVLRR